MAERADFTFYKRICASIHEMCLITREYGKYYADMLNFQTDSLLGGQCALYSSGT